MKMRAMAELRAERIQAAQRQANVCRLFGNSRRILILWALKGQELSVGEIAATIGATLPNTSQHLRLMKDAEILESRRDGQTVYYRLAGNEFLEMCDLIARAKKELNHDDG